MGKKLAFSFSIGKTHNSGNTGSYTTDVNSLTDGDIHIGEKCREWNFADHLVVDYNRINEQGVINASVPVNVTAYTSNDSLVYFLVKFPRYGPINIPRRVPFGLACKEVVVLENYPVCGDVFH